jgi:hypothetical protein
MANKFAYLALAAWPLVVWWLFRNRRVEVAVIWSFLGAFLLLPSSVGYDLPLIPEFDRESIPALTVLAMLLLQGATRQRLRLLPESGPARVLLVILVITPFLTALTNGDRLRIGETVLPGLRPYDGAAMLNVALVAVLPLLIGRSLLADPSSHREILRAFCIAGLAYSLPMLFEIRMSPQLHLWVYGFRPRGFAQMIRFEGFRPTVFLRSGLWLALFAMAALTATAALARADREAVLGRAEAARQRMLYAGATLYLAVLLVLCRSVGALVLGLVTVPAVLLLGPLMQMRLAAAMGSAVILYPVLRSNGLVPVDFLLGQAARLSEATAGSLRVRFENEAAMLARALQRPWFGWGPWNRNRVFDPETGADVTIADGFWVLTIGVSGWAGYVAVFGLLTLPLVLVWWRSGRAAGAIPRETAALGLIIGANMVYLIPNSAQSNWLWLMAGALLGYAESLRPVPQSAAARLKAARVGAAAARPGRPALSRTRPGGAAGSGTAADEGGAGLPAPAPPDRRPPGAPYARPSARPSAPRP